MRENLVQFSSKQENQTRKITFVNNLYQNYQVSLNYLFFCHIIFEHNKLYQQTTSFIDCIMSTQLCKRCKVINAAKDYGTKNILTIYFFSTNYLETHAI